MKRTSYNNFKRNLKSCLDSVCINQTPLFIIREKEEDVVVLAKSEYEAIQETLHLLGSSKNAKRLLSGIEKYKRGELIEKGLEE